MFYSKYSFQSGTSQTNLEETGNDVTHVVLHVANESGAQQEESELEGSRSNEEEGCHVTFRATGQPVMNQVRSLSPFHLLRSLRH